MSHLLALSRVTAFAQRRLFDLTVAALVAMLASSTGLYVLEDTDFLLWVTRVRHVGFVTGPTDLMATIALTSAALLVVCVTAGGLHGGRAVDGERLIG